MHRVLKLNFQHHELSEAIKGTFLLIPLGNQVPNVKPGIRCQSTRHKAAVQPSKLKKKLIKPRKYAELLEINGKTTTETRASISSLKPKDFSFLTQRPEIALNELHKIRLQQRKKDALSLHAAVSSCEEVPAFEEADSEELGDDLFAASIEDSSETKCDRLLEECEASFDSAGREKAGKEESLYRLLHAFVDVCIFLDQEEKALATLKYYRSRADRIAESPAVRNISLYNSLLQVFAAKEKLRKMNETLSLIEEEGIALNVHSYAAILECYGRLPASASNDAALQSHLKKMSACGFTADLIMNQAMFCSDQRDFVLKAFRRSKPNYTPKYLPPDVQYICPLLMSLNKPEQSRPVDSTEEFNGGTMLFSGDELKDLAKYQLENEIKGFIKVKSVQETPELTETVLQSRRAMEMLMVQWRKTAADAFDRDLKTLRAQIGEMKALTIQPYLACLQPEQFVDVLMSEVRRLAEGSETYSPTVLQLYRELGSQIHARYQVERRRRSGSLEKTKHVHAAYCDWYSKAYGKGAEHNWRQGWQWMQDECKWGPSSQWDAQQHAWPTGVLSAVGQFLYNIIVRDLKVDVNAARPNSNRRPENLLPAFYTIFRSQGRVTKEEVKPHPALVRMVRSAREEVLTFATSQVPMTCPPVPWCSLRLGGLMLVSTDLVRLPLHAVQQLKRMNSCSPASLYPAMDSLNQLGAVPWSVNEPVLDVALKVFREGGSQKLTVPQPPEACPLPLEPGPDADKAERHRCFRLKLQVRRKRSEMYSLWCDALYRLSLANHFRGKVFWLPHNMDFRGRVYPVPPHLNHLGSDLARSLLLFAEERPLGPNGLDWLKIHLINLTGLKKKESQQKRLEYANKMINEILDSADKPLDGRMWWSEADEPWQTLACCKEVAKAMRCDNPEEYMCRFPVHQDGSCNGLQHYAALGRDSAGAISVNLAPSDSPQDVYEAVTGLVEKRRIEDEACDSSVAKSLRGFVKRKVIKQTVMTTVYGVTRFGARLQIAKQLKDIDEFPKEMVWPASSYLTGKTFESIRSMFRSAREIQDWFTDCARLISAVCNQNVEWITPLGLPVVQPYNRYRKLDHSKTKLPEYFAMDMFERPNIMKQKNAFPPNFIHSLDSSHMMLTALFCEKAKISFVSVHDCFWTHPSSVHIMNKICRDQFVALHSEPILENLSEYLVKKFSCRDVSNSPLMDVTKKKLNRVLQEVPTKGNFDITSVRKSTYFFS